ncbi:MAG: alpha/beta hydrolase [Afipia sp.]|nr:alpha/beta hydrolase [Afipia sp.]
MFVSGFVIALVVLALVTQAGVFALSRMYPPSGKFIEVSGGRIHYVELGPTDATGLPIVLVHGASSSLETMRPLGEALAKTRRVFLIDRPGLGWSTRDSTTNTTPAIQARMVDEALGKLGIARAILLGHSLGGAIMPEMALTYPQRVAGIVMLSPVLYTWPGGVGRFNNLATVPVLGPLLAYTITLPIGWFMVDAGSRYVFSPQTMPDSFVNDTQVRLVLRSRTFLNNAWDLATLKAEVTKRSPDYPQIKVPVTIVTGDSDNTVSPKLHSRHFAQAVSQTKLIVLPGVGHMPQYAKPGLIVDEVESIMRDVARYPAAAAN